MRRDGAERPAFSLRGLAADAQVAISKGLIEVSNRSMRNRRARSAALYAKSKAEEACARARAALWRACAAPGAAATRAAALVLRMCACAAAHRGVARRGLLQELRAALTRGRQKATKTKTAGDVQESAGVHLGEHTGR